jgi:hypothetical protein
MRVAQGLGQTFSCVQVRQSLGKSTKGWSATHTVK